MSTDESSFGVPGEVSARVAGAFKKAAGEAAALIPGEQKEEVVEAADLAEEQEKYEQEKALVSAAHPEPGVSVSVGAGADGVESDMTGYSSSIDSGLYSSPISSYGNAVIDVDRTEQEPASRETLLNTMAYVKDIKNKLKSDMVDTIKALGSEDPTDTGEEMSHTQIPCTLVGPVKQIPMGEEPPAFSQELGDLLRYHEQIPGLHGGDPIVATIVKRIVGENGIQGDSYLYEVRDHMGHAIASGTCARYDVALQCADGVLYQFGYLTEGELPKALESVRYPVTGMLPKDIIDHILSLNDGEMMTVGQLLRTPYSEVSEVLNSAEIAMACRALGKATKPPGLVQLLIPDAATATGTTPRAASHRSHGNPMLPAFLQRFNEVRRKLVTHQGSRKKLLEEHERLTMALLNMHTPTVSPGFLAAFISSSETTTTTQEATMARTDDSVLNNNDIDDIDDEASSGDLLSSIMANPTMALFVGGGVDSAKMVSAVKAQGLFRHIARKIATKFIGEKYIGVLNTPGGDIIVSLCLPLAVHAVATTGPKMGLKVPGAKPLTAISDVAYRGQVVRIGLQYAPELTDIYDMVSSEIGELVALGSALLGPDDDVELGLPDHSDADAIASLVKEREKVKVSR